MLVFYFLAIMLASLQGSLITSMNTNAIFALLIILFKKTVRWTEKKSSTSPAALDFHPGNLCGPGQRDISKFYWNLQIKNSLSRLLERSLIVWVPSLVSALDDMWEWVRLTPRLPNPARPVPFSPCSSSFFSFLAAMSQKTSRSHQRSPAPAILCWQMARYSAPSDCQHRHSKPLKELFLHSFSRPFWLVKGDYKKLAQFVKKRKQRSYTQRSNRIQSDWTRSSSQSSFHLRIQCIWWVFDILSVDLECTRWTEKQLSTRKTHPARIDSDENWIKECNNGNLQINQTFLCAMCARVGPDCLDKKKDVEKIVS